MSAPPKQAAPQVWRGILLFSLALMLFACLDATAKYLSQHWPVGWLAWARYAGHLLLMLGLMGPSWGRRLAATRRPWLLLGRGMLLVAVTVLSMRALSLMPLAETTAMLFASPLLVVLASKPLLGEKIGRLRWCAVLVGLAGVLLLTRPGAGLNPQGVACALGAALAYAAYQLLTRHLAASERPVPLLFYTAVAGTGSLSLLLPWLGTPPAPSLGQGLGLAALGLLGGGGHYLLTRAFREAPASLLSPLMYSQLLWATLLGAVVFAQHPPPSSVAGMLVIGLAGVIIAYDGSRQVARDTQAGGKPTPPAP